MGLPAAVQEKTSLPEGVELFSDERNCASMRQAKKKKNRSFVDNHTKRRKV